MSGLCNRIGPHFFVLHANNKEKDRLQMTFLKRIWKHLKVSAVFLSLCGFFAEGVVAEEQIFLEGFPDVPLLEDFEEQLDARVIFDAPSGTVAETVIRASVKGAKMLDSYAKELPVFGWVCLRQPATMRCTREESVLVFLDENPAAESGVIILRLEPAN